MSKLDVFIIDDSEINNTITRQIASQHNRINNISTYTDAIEALSVMVKADEHNQKLPDLILLDIQMPEMDGYEWLDEIDEHFDDPNFVVIFVSGTNYQKDFESFEKQRLAKELLPKPITKEIFDKIITDYFV